MKNILIIGHGVAGKQLEKILLDKGYLIRGFLDDNISGDSVIGKIDDLEKILGNNDINDVYFSIPSYEDKTKIFFLRQICNIRNIGFKIIPGLVEIIDDEVDINFLRDVKIDDLLGRPINKTNAVRIKEFVKGKTILVTGAGGTIGSELVKQLSIYGANKVIGIDHSEISIFELNKKFEKNHNTKLYIRTLKDIDGLQNVFSKHNIDTVFNAAAYKHVHLMEENPSEAVKNNIIGLKNLIDVSIKNNVENFCQISTDKAVNPTNIMGATKRIGELLLHYYSERHIETKFVAVRFGNVLGSSGSVLTIFEEQIKKGLSLTVTSKDIIRYFMTLAEAVNLVISSVTLNETGKIFILDMGDPVRIYDLAKQYIELSGAIGTGIDIIGLKTGEKLYEELILDKDHDKGTLINKVYVTEDNGNIKNLLINISNLSKAKTKKEILSLLKDIIPEFNHAINLK
ncbi:MAG: polysaccharide biosynthesis protein [Candidatus Gracilibacteria bacterium]